MAKINFKESATLALPVTAAVWLVSYLFGLLKIGTTPLFSTLTPTSVVTGTVGEKVMGFIGGILPFEFSIGAIFTIYVSAVAAIIVGTFLIGQFKLPVFRKFLGFNGTAGKIASVLLYGAIPVYLVLVGFKFPSFMTIIGAVIHTMLVAFVAVWVANLLKLKI